jgi:hypothetical protein
MTLIHTRVRVTDPVVGHAFATPTIVHFCIALFLSALVRAPFQSMKSVAIIWGLVGLVGFFYCGLIHRRIRIQDSYEPEFEDWLFHVLLPLASYLTLVISAIGGLIRISQHALRRRAAALVLLFVGIHNAWDAVTYHVFVLSPRENGSDETETSVD